MNTLQSKHLEVWKSSNQEIWRVAVLASVALYKNDRFNLTIYTLLTCTLLFFQVCSGEKWNTQSLELIHRLIRRSRPDRCHNLLHHASPLVASGFSLAYPTKGQQQR